VPILWDWIAAARKMKPTVMNEGTGFGTIEEPEGYQQTVDRASWPVAAVAFALASCVSFSSLLDETKVVALPLIG
jgi:hypothetical protein